MPQRTSPLHSFEIIITGSNICIHRQLSNTQHLILRYVLNDHTSTYSCSSLSACTRYAIQSTTHTYVAACHLCLQFVQTHSHNAEHLPSQRIQLLMHDYQTHSMCCCLQPDMQINAHSADRALEPEPKLFVGIRVRQRQSISTMYTDIPLAMPPNRKMPTQLYNYDILISLSNVMKHTGMHLD